MIKEKVWRNFHPKGKYLVKVATIRRWLQERGLFTKHSNKTLNTLWNPTEKDERLKAPKGNEQSDI